MIPDISVVVPIYNLSKFLPRCFESLLKQTIDNYEIILVDDGSTDDSGTLCDQYHNEYKEFVRCIHKRNGGLSSARNAGIDAANGKYIIFPDPDDWVEPDYLEKLLLLQLRESVDLVCTGYKVEFDSKSVLANLGQQYRTMSKEKAQLSLLISGGMGGFAWNKLYHLDIIRREKLYFLDDVGTTEDLDFAFRYIQHCSMVCFAPDVRTYHYYQHKNAATHGGFSERKVASIHTYEKILQVVGNNSEIGIAAKEEICNTAINLIVMFLNSGNDDKKLYKKIRSYIKEYYWEYIKSTHYGLKRKAQAVLARYSPKLYQKVRNIIAKE